MKKKYYPNRKKIPVVYCFTLPDGRKYIGSTMDESNRRESWYKRFRYKDNCKTPPPSIDFIEAVISAGEDNVKYEILENFEDVEITRDKLEILETKWLFHFQTHLEENGFNFKHPLTGKFLRKVKKEYPKKPNPIICLCAKTGNFLKEYFNQATIVEELGLNRKRIESCTSYWRNLESRKKHLSKSYKGYIFINKNIYDENFDYVGYEKERIRVAPYKPKKEPIKIERVYKLPINAKPIRLENSETNKFLYYSSVKEAVRCLNLVESKVRNALSNEYKRYTHRNYWFKFITMEEYLENKSLYDIVLPEKSKHLKNLSS